MMEKSFLDRCNTFDENFKEINEKISLAAEKSGRSREDITLLAATKTVPVDIINHAIDSGLEAMGENRVQEFLDKYDNLHKESGCDIQFIGQLQSNKVKYLVGKVSTIQSVDSVKLAKEISRISQRGNTTTKVLVEVNIAGEENKGGITPNSLYEFIDEIRELPNIMVNGLMTIPPICEKDSELMGYFSRMQEYYVDIIGKNIDNVYMNCLSMGMSGDYELAIRCGATMVRVGSSLFGERK